MRLFWMLGCVLLLTPEHAAAVDYDKVERKLTKEPAYQTKNPKYALLLFGPEARLPVWVVLDGETVYVDLNSDGDLTGTSERFAIEAEWKHVEIADSDVKTRYVITSVRPEPRFIAKIRRERAAKGILPQLLVEVSIKGPVEYRQYCDVQGMQDDPRTALIAHFHGPLTIGPRTINGKVPEGGGLKTGDSPSELSAIVGTMSAKHGCWVVVSSHDGDRAAFPKGIHPVVEIDFPSNDPQGKPIRQMYQLDKFC